MNTLLTHLLLMSVLLGSGLASAEQEAATDGGQKDHTIRVTIDKDDISGSLKEAKEEIQAALQSLEDNGKGDIEIELDEESEGEFMVGMEDGLGLGETLIAFTAIMMSLGMPIIVLISVLIYQHRRRRQKMELIKTYLDSNQPVPEHLLNSLDSGGASSNLSVGIRFIGLGIGLMIALAIVVSYKAAALALIPLFVGLARLVLWKLEDDDPDAR